jgi:hypothetical protein
MGKIVRLVIPEPIKHNGRERFVNGWSTAGVGQWLLNKKLGEHFTSLSEVASTVYGRDCEGNRQLVKNNLAALRRWLADHNEFLLVQYGHMRRVTAVKVCNPAEEGDRFLAMGHLHLLEARGEITEAERDRWAAMLFVPPQIGA